MTLRKKLIDILSSLGYKVFENIELKGNSGLSYAVDIYAIKEEPFINLRIVFLIPENVIKKEDIIDAKMIYSDVPEVDKIVIVCTKGIEKEAYKLSESGESILLMDEITIDKLYDKIARKITEFDSEFYTLKLSIDDKTVKKIVKEYIFSRKWFNAKLKSIELVYKPYYLVYSVIEIDNKPIFTGLIIDGISGDISQKHSELVFKVPSIMKKKLYSINSIPYDVLEYKINEDTLKGVVEAWFGHKNIKILQLQKIYVPFWVVEVDCSGKSYRLEVCGTTGEIHGEIPESKILVNKIISYIYNPSEFSKLGKYLKNISNLFKSKEQRIIVLLIVLIILIILVVR